MAGAPAMIAIGMPVYNEERHLQEALDSLLCQSLQDFEIVISDNGSTDATREIALSYAARDPRVCYHRSDANLGSNANFNRVFRLTRSRYFTWASGHDLRTPTFLERCLDVLESDESCVLCYPQARWLEENGRCGALIHGNVDTRGLDTISAVNVLLWGLAYAYPIYGVVRTDALARTALLRDTMGADIPLLMELAFLGSIAQVPECLLLVRRLPDFGQIRPYLRKAFGVHWRDRAASRLYLRWVLEALRVIGRRSDSWRKRAVLSASVLLCFGAKYGFMRTSLRGLKAGGRQRQAAVPVT